MSDIVLFHVGNPSFREKILKEGLTPQFGDSYKSHYESSYLDMGKAIFVSSVNDYDSTYDDDRYQITLTKEEFDSLNFKKDLDVENALYTNEMINMRNIKLIHTGSGESTF